MTSSTEALSAFGIDAATQARRFMSGIDALGDAALRNGVPQEKILELASLQVRDVLRRLLRGQVDPIYDVEPVLALKRGTIVVHIRLLNDWMFVDPTSTHYIIEVELWRRRRKAKSAGGREEFQQFGVGDSDSEHLISVSLPPFLRRNRVSDEAEHRSIITAVRSVAEAARKIVASLPQVTADQVDAMTAELVESTIASLGSRLDRVGKPGHWRIERRY